MASNAELLERTGKYLIANYGPPLLAMVRGEGSRIWDADGREYIDFFAGFGGGGVTGHCHPRIVAAVQEQAKTLLSHGNFFTNVAQVELAGAIVEHAFPGKVFFCHSGGEAAEAALKLVRLAAGEGRYKVISFNQCFHGRTMGALSLTPERFQKGFGPMLPGSVKVDLGDIEAVRAAVDEQTAAVFVEPIQGEGGVNVPAAEFMRDLRQLCDQKNLLLVCDEVWTGPARTGKWFAHQHFDITPDVMTLAKALGGGLPVGACLAGEKYADVLGPGTHGCTMGGNPLCASAGAACMRLIEEEDLVARAGKKGAEVMRAIRDAGIGRVKQVRGKGMMIGLELDTPAREVFLSAMEHGLLVCYAGEKVLRLAPPLVIGEADLSEGLEILMAELKR
jgi:acetylornithine/N-succinyldiaminopimelate aminotransferase